MIRKWIYKLRYILIILSALLGLMGLSQSFGVGVYAPIGTSAESPFNSAYRVNILKKGSFLSSTLGYSKSILATTDDFLAWRTDSGLPYLYTPYRQGYAAKYRVCSVFTGGSTIQNCTEHLVGDSSVNAFATFLSSVKEGDYYYVESHNANWQYGLSFCISSNVIGQSLCFWVSRCNYNATCDDGSMVSNSENYENLTFSSALFDDIINSQSPGVSAPGGGTRGGSLVVNQPRITNGDIVLGYEAMGLQQGLCYGGFPIDNIFTPGETSEDFTGYVFGTGATIFDIYNLYSGSFSNPKDFLATLNQKYVNNSINSFKTEPKALLMLIQQYHTFTDTYGYSFTLNQLWDYCDLRFNSDLGGQWNTSEEGQSALKQYVVNQISNITNNGTGSSVLNIYNQVLFGSGSSVALLSGDDLAWDMESFFSNVSNGFLDGVGQLESGVVGIIPTYILMVLVALIFIRIISH